MHTSKQSNSEMEEGEKRKGERDGGREREQTRESNGDAYCVCV